MRNDGNDKSSSSSYDDIIHTNVNGPHFIITIDTEEEFDWDQPFTRENHSLEHIASIEKFQKLCNQNNVNPIYLVDYPIVANDAAVELIGHYVKRNLADVGIQLHGWVNPPFDEDVNNFNSYASNLPPELERAKLTNLYEFIEKRFAIKPMIYRAGRYGAGLNTYNILRDLGVKIDTSVRSRFSYKLQDGPDYSKYPINPYWIEKNTLLELPVTTVFNGLLGNISSNIYHDIFESKIARSILARTQLIERIALTPEGTPANKAVQGINRALKEGVKILNFSFHSPSLSPGYTPYIRSERDLELFYEWWDIIFAHLSKCEVTPISMDQIIDAYFDK